MPHSTTESVFIAESLDDLREIRPEPDTGFAPGRVWASPGLVDIRQIAFAPGGLLPEHTPPHPVVIQVIEGHIDFTIGDDTRALGAGAVLFIPLGITHSARARDTSRLLLTLLG